MMEFIVGASLLANIKIREQARSDEGDAPTKAMILERQ
jgi:hypothetical protein